MDWDKMSPRRPDTSRVQHLGSVGCNFLGFLIAQVIQQARRWYRLGIGRKQARHIGPYLQAFGADLGCKISGRYVGSASSQHHRLSFPIAADKALRYDNAAGFVQPITY